MTDVRSANVEDLSTRTLPATPVLRQPVVGLAGLVVVAAGWLLLGSVLGGPQNSLEIVFPITTFALPLLVVIAIWWAGWPFAKLGRARGGAANLLLVAAGALLLAGVGQAVVGRIDVGGLFSNATAMPEGTFTGFPWTVPLAVVVFAVMLHLTFVLGKWPFAKLGPRLAGFAALGLSWASGTAAYLLLVNWGQVPAEVRAGLGVHNVNGPIWALDFVGGVVTVIVWQLTFMLLLGGWPFARITNAATRSLVATAILVAGGIGTFVGLKDGLNWAIPKILAVDASAVAAIVLLALLFETWPYAKAAPPVARLGLLGTAAALTGAQFVMLQGVGNALQTWDRQPVELWVAACGLNYIAGPVIVHCLFFGRWPLPSPPQE